MNEEFNRYILSILKPIFDLKDIFGKSSSVFNFNYNKNIPQSSKPQSIAETPFIGSAVFNWSDKFHDNRFFNRNYLSSISIPSYLNYLKTMPYDLESLATESRALTIINNKNTIGKFRITVNKPIGLINLNFYSLAQLILNQREVQTLDAVVDDFVVSSLNITYNPFYQFDFSYDETENLLDSVLGGLPNDLHGTSPSTPSSANSIFNGFLKNFTILDINASSNSSESGVLTNNHTLVYEYRLIHTPSFHTDGMYYYLTFGYTDRTFYRYDPNLALQNAQSQIGTYNSIGGDSCVTTSIVPLYYLIDNIQVSPTQFNDYIETGLLNGNPFGGSSFFDNNGDRSSMTQNENENYSSCYSKHVLPISDSANPFVNSPFLSPNQAVNINNLPKIWLNKQFGLVIQVTYLCQRPSYAGGDYTINSTFALTGAPYYKETSYMLQYKMQLNSSSSSGSGASFLGNTVGLDAFKDENNNNSAIEETKDYSEGIFWFYYKHRKNVYNFLTNILDHYSAFKHSAISVLTGLFINERLRYSKVNNYIVPQCSYLMVLPLVFRASNLIKFLRSASELSTITLPSINGNTILSSLLCFYYRSPFDNNVSSNFPFSEDNLNKLKNTECRLPDREVSLNCVLYLGDVKKAKTQDLPYIDVNLQKPQYSVDIFDCIDLGVISIEYKNYTVNSSTNVVDKLKTKTKLFKSFDFEFLDVNVFDVSNFKFYLHEFLYKFFKLSKLWVFCSSLETLSLANIKGSHRGIIQKLKKRWSLVVAEKPELNTFCVTLPFNNALKKEDIEDYIKINPLLVGTKMTNTFKNIYEQNTVINVIDNF